MRLWSIHPKYLDSRGLVALWREALLAQAVLAGRTRGYTRHPQLNRFRAMPAPLNAVGAYLQAVCDEAVRRGYHFDRSRIMHSGKAAAQRVTRGQIGYEWNHLLAKLKRRSPETYRKARNVVRPSSHPLFTVTAGGIEPWEIMKKKPKVRDDRHK